MILQIVAAISGISVVISLLFLARQASELARQTRLSNRIGTLTAMHDALEILQGIQGTFTDRPDLRAYFYEGKRCPRQGRRKSTLINIAEMIADAIDYGLTVISLLPGTEEYEGWKNYALFILRNSPILQELMNEHSDWYLAYKRLITESSSSS